MFGAKGWHGWQRTPWSIGALETWYWSQRRDDRARLAPNAWVDYLEGKNPAYAESARRRDLAGIRKKVAKFRADDSLLERRLADNMMNSNPAAAAALVQLMWGAPLPGRERGLLNARLRYFDPEQKRACVPDDVGALVSGMSDRRTVVTLVNLSPTASRRVLVQGGGYGEHRIESVEQGGRRDPGGCGHIFGAARAGRGRNPHAHDDPLRARADRRVALGPALNFL